MQTIDDLYSEVNTLYNNPLMYKLRNDVHENRHLSTSIYYTKIRTLLAKDSNYLYANVDLDMTDIGTPVRLNVLRWKCFQTRTTDEYIVFNKAHEHSYTSTLYPKRPNTLHSEIRIKERTNTNNLYSCSMYPVVVVIIHDNDTYHYRDTGTIFKALELYNTLIVKI